MIIPPAVLIMFCKMSGGRYDINDMNGWVEKLVGSIALAFGCWFFWTFSDGYQALIGYIDYGIKVASQ